MSDKEKFKELLKWYTNNIVNNPALRSDSTLQEAMRVLYRCLEWELHNLDECIKFEAALRNYVTGAGPMSDATQPFFDLQRKMDEHAVLFTSVVMEQIDLLSRVQIEMRKKSLTVMEVPQLLAVRNRIEELTNIQDVRLGECGDDSRYDNRLSTMHDMIQENTFYRKVLKPEVNKVTPATTTISNRRNVIVAEFSGLTLYIDVAGVKLHDSEAAIIAGYCYQDLFRLYGEGVDNKITTGEISQLSVCFSHKGEGKGKIVYQEVADAEIIKSFEDTLYNKKAE